jgi:hypothetical protein
MVVDGFDADMCGDECKQLSKSHSSNGTLFQGIRAGCISMNSEIIDSD